MGVLWIPVTVVGWALVPNLLLPESAVDPVLIPTCMAIVVWGLWRASRISLKLDSQGFEARNFYRTYSGQWDQVCEITAVVAHGPFGSTLGFVLKEKGRLVGRRIVAPQAGLRGGAQAEKEACFRWLAEIARVHEIDFMLKLDGSEFDSLPRGPWAGTGDE